MKGNRGCFFNTLPDLSYQTVSVWTEEPQFAAIWRLPEASALLGQGDDHAKGLKLYRQSVPLSIPFLFGPKGLITPDGLTKKDLSDLGFPLADLAGFKNFPEAKSCASYRAGKWPDDPKHKFEDLKWSVGIVPMKEKKGGGGSGGSSPSSSGSAASESSTSTGEEEVQPLTRSLLAREGGPEQDQTQQSQTGNASPAASLDLNTVFGAVKDVTSGIKNAFDTAGTGLSQALGGVVGPVTNAVSSVQDTVKGVTGPDPKYMERQCYRGGGEFFPIVGTTSGRFSPLVKAAYLTLRALYLSSHFQRIPIGGNQYTASRTNKFSDLADKLQRVWPEPTGCFKVNDIDELNTELFPKDKPDAGTDQSIRHIHWNMRVACVCQFRGIYPLPIWGADLGPIPFGEGCHPYQHTKKSEGDIDHQDKINGLSAPWPPWPYFFPLPYSEAAALVYPFVIGEGFGSSQTTEGGNQGGQGQQQGGQGGQQSGSNGSSGGTTGSGTGGSSGGALGGVGGTVQGAINSVLGENSPIGSAIGNVVQQVGAGGSFTGALGNQVGGALGGGTFGDIASGVVSGAAQGGLNNGLSGAAQGAIGAGAGAVGGQAGGFISAATGSNAAGSIAGSIFSGGVTGAVNGDALGGVVGAGTNAANGVASTVVNSVANNPTVQNITNAATTAGSVIQGGSTVVNSLGGALGRSGSSNARTSPSQPTSSNKANSRSSNIPEESSSKEGKGFDHF